MWTIIKETMRESIHKRFSITIMVVAVLLLFMIAGLSRFQTMPDGKVMVWNRTMESLEPAENQVHEWQLTLIIVSAEMMTLFGIFAMAPLLATPLEKGNVELVMPKGLTRTEVMMGRILGSTLVYSITLLALNGFALAYLRWHVPLDWVSHMEEVGMAMVGFMALMSVMALVASFHPGQGHMIVAGYGVWILSDLLENRASYYPALKFEWVKGAVNFVYLIFPKNSELNDMALRHFRFTTHDIGAKPITNWAPIWSTALFTLVMFAISLWKTERKSF